MGYTLSKPAPSKGDPTAKNRVWDFFGEPVKQRPANRPQSLQPRRKIRPCSYKTASGIPYWPSRDPIGEIGGINLYGFVGNDGLNGWDLLGLECNEGQVKFIKFCITVKVGMMEEKSKQFCSDSLEQAVIDVTKDQVEDYISNKNTNEKLKNFQKAISLAKGVIDKYELLMNISVFKGNFSLRMSVNYSCCVCDTEKDPVKWYWGAENEAFWWLNDEDSGVTYPSEIELIKDHYDFAIIQLADQIKKTCNLGESE